MSMTPTRPSQKAREGEGPMMKTTNAISLWVWCRFQSLQNDCQGQDLVEYALMVGFVALAVIGLSPQVSLSLTIIWSRVRAVTALAAAV